ncbi:MAG: hypothetical protein CSB46_01600 [Micrococcales bacterium]|nr:MAG: hypothetical protein CSB46_01600 [Micrococcales bacterium]
MIGEQLARIARRPGAEVAVQALPGEDERGGLGYRTRIDLVAGADGRPGMHRHRAAEVLALDSMPLAVPQLAGFGLFERRFAPGARVRAVAPGDGPPVVLVDGVPVAPDGSAADVRLGRSRYVREVVRLPGVAEWRYRAGRSRMALPGQCRGFLAGASRCSAGPGRGRRGRPDRTGLGWAGRCRSVQRGGLVQPAVGRPGGPVRAGGVGGGRPGRGAQRPA